MDPIWLMMAIIIVVSHLHLSVSRVGIEWLATMLNFIYLEIVSVHSGGRVSAVPTNIRKLIKWLSIKPDSVDHLCCPRCFALYTLDCKPLSMQGSFPSTTLTNLPPTSRPAKSSSKGQLKKRKQQSKMPQTGLPHSGEQDPTQPNNSGSESDKAAANIP